MGGVDLTVAPCSHDAARYAVLHWHYSKVMPSGKLVKYGAWEDGRFVGAVIFGRGASAPLAVSLEGRYGIPVTAWAELTRVALTAHQVPVSAIVARALEQLRADCPGLRLVVSFADPEQGHVGGIYQAGNWTYTGRSASVVQYWIRGRWRHERGAHAEKTARTLRRSRVGKYRYEMPLDRAMRRQVARHALPFPRGSGLEGEPPAVLAGSPGPTPGIRSDNPRPPDSG